MKYLICILAITVSFSVSSQEERLFELVIPTEKKMLDEVVKKMENFVKTLPVTVSNGVIHKEEIRRVLDGNIGKIMEAGGIPKCDTYKIKFPEGVSVFPPDIKVGVGFDRPEKSWCVVYLKISILEVLAIQRSVKTPHSHINV